MAPLWGSGDTAADEPKFTSQLENMDTSNLTVFGVDAAEVAVADTTKYAVAHQGWVGVTTYMDNSVSPAVLRVKSETLVAIGITGLDQSDDAVFPDTP